MLLQVVANIIVSASLYVLVAVGFSLSYSVTRFIQFSQAGLITFAAYLLYLFHIMFAMPWYLAIIMCVFGTIGIGYSINKIVYNPLQKSGAGTTVLLIASLGTYVVIENMLSILAGTGTMVIGSFEVWDLGFANWYGVRITTVQCMMIFVALICWVGLITWQHHSLQGLAIRALADDSELGEIFGIKKDQFVFIANAISAGFFGIVGALIASDIGIYPTMGITPFIMGAIVSISSGKGSIIGIPISAIILSVVQHTANWYIGGEWQEGTALLVLFIVLLIRTKGKFRTFFRTTAS